MTRSVLVTGGLGYLGGRICRHLESTGGIRIRLTTRREPASRLEWARNMDVRAVDFGDVSSLDGICDGIDAVIHLAALNAQQSAADPAAAERINVEGTAALESAAEDAGVTRFIYASTAHVYGAPLDGEIDETTPTRPVHPYATTHLAAEDAVQAAAAPMSGIVLRLSNAIGAPADADANCWMLAGNDMCRQAVTGGKIVLRGSGTERRDFIPLSDVTRAIEHTLKMDLPARGDCLFNLGTGKCMSVFELAERIADRAASLLDVRVEITREPPDPNVAVADLVYRIDRLRRTGFEPAGDLDVEIDATLRLCRREFAVTETSA